MLSEKIEKPKKIVFTEKYGVDIGGHVFPTVKYGLIYERLMASGLVQPDVFVEPEPAEDEDILLVHTHDYVHKLKTGTLSKSEILTMELPYSKELAQASWLCAGGTILACRIAMETGLGIHLGGGFHHAFPDHGEGFCVFNDVAIAIKSLQKHGQVERILVVDCDLHQGNGTAVIFSRDKTVFTFSIHQAHNYPFYKPASDADINLPDGCRDNEYLEHLKVNLPDIIDNFSPGLIIYLAGADPYEHDQLGGLALSMDGLKKRDEYVLTLARKNRVPVAITLAGGYALQIKDTVQIHFNTVKTALEIFKD